MARTSIKKTTDYDQEKKSQMSLGTEIYTSDSAIRTLQKEKGCQPVTCNLFLSRAKELWGQRGGDRLLLELGGTERNRYHYLK